MLDNSQRPSIPHIHGVTSLAATVSLQAPPPSQYTHTHTHSHSYSPPQPQNPQIEVRGHASEHSGSLRLPRYATGGPALGLLLSSSFPTSPKVTGAGPTGTDLTAQLWPAAPTALATHWAPSFSFRSRPAVASLLSHTQLCDPMRPSMPSPCSSLSPRVCSNSSPSNR